MRFKLSAVLLCVVFLVQACSSTSAGLPKHSVGKGRYTPGSTKSGEPRHNVAATTPVPPVTYGPVKRLKVALVVPRLGDKGMYDSSARGVKMARDRLHSKVRIIQTGGQLDSQVRALQKVSRDDYDLVITGGPEMQRAAEKVARRFPKQRYVLFGVTTALPNVANISFAQNQSSFLAGVLSACVGRHPTGSSITVEVPVIGIVVAQNTQTQRELISGFEQGARYVDRDVRVLTFYTNDYNDPSAGKTAADSEFNQGASVIYQSTGKAGLGVLGAARKWHRWAIGFAANQNHLYPGTVLTSVLMRVDIALFDLVQIDATSTLRTGRTYAYGLENNGVGLAKDKFYYKYVSSSCQEEVEQAQSDLASGRVQVDTSLDTQLPRGGKLQLGTWTAYNPATRQRISAPIFRRVFSK